MNNIDINTIFERNEVKNQIMNVLREFENNYNNINHKRGIYLYGSPGSGKTHFTYQFREIAWKNNYVTCYVTLDSKNVQFNKILSVYQAICKNIQKPLGEDEKIQIFGTAKKPEELGLGNMMKHWFYTKRIF